MIEDLKEAIIKRTMSDKMLNASSEELRTRNECLEKMNKAFVGRELRMAELKNEIGELIKKSKN